MNFPSPGARGTMGRARKTSLSSIGRERVREREGRREGGIERERGSMLWRGKERENMSHWQKGKGKKKKKHYAKCLSGICWNVLNFQSRGLVLYKIMLMPGGPLWLAACCSRACVPGRNMERAQWDSPFLLKQNLQTPDDEFASAKCSSLPFFPSLFLFFFKDGEGKGG